jgi:bifunctional non-homologous end joining protein LigD
VRRPAQPVKASKPPVGTDWVHEIKHDGYPELIKATSFRLTARRLCSGRTACHGSTSFPVRGAAQTAILHAFDLIEHDGGDLRNLPFLDRKAALARLLRETEAGILLNEHIAEDGPTVYAHACRLGAEGIVSKRVDGTYRLGACRIWIKVRNHASVDVQRSEARFGIAEPQAVRA